MKDIEIHRFNFNQLIEELVVGKASNDTKDAWKYTSDLGKDMATGAAVGQLMDSNIAPAFESSDCDLMSGGWSLWKEFGDKGGKDKLMVDYHDFHRARGEEYSSYCDVCKS